LSNNIDSNEAAGVGFCNSKGKSLCRASNSDSAEQYWYAVHTRRHHENIVVNILKAKKIETYLPLVEERRCWAHRSKVVKVPLFPNYLFARFDESRRLDVIIVKGVIQIVGTVYGPSAIPDGQIKAVQTMLKTEVQKDAYPFLVKGTFVRVKQGQLKGLEGVLLRKGDIHRFVVCLPVLGQSIGVEINASALEVV